jgi:hydroxyacylglutathione hydrolase
VAGDSQFDGRPSTTLVPADQASACSFFGLRDWPAGIVTFDLGGRVLEVTGCPAIARLVAGGIWWKVRNRIPL